MVLSAIHVYPVKSCRAVALDRVRVARTGLEGDRLFQVVDVDGNPVTQRQQPTLATVQPTLVEGGLRLESQGARSIEVATPTANDTTVTSLLGTAVEAADVGDEAAAWFSAVLDLDVRLVAMTDASEYRPLPGLDVSWADAAPVLVANEASHEWLASRADAGFGMDRFRPNLTVSVDEPWVEDTWRDFSIGAATLGLTIPWPRCAIPQVDQQDGSRHQEPAKVLRTHRWCTDASAAGEALQPLLEGNALFGLACSIGPVGTELSIGDEVVVRETAAPLVPAPT